MSVTTIPLAPSRIIPANSSRTRSWEEMETAFMISFRRVYFQITQLELHRRPCIALEPAENPHEQENWNRNAQQPK